MKLARILFALALLICLLPIGSVALAGWLAERHGCTLHEGFANPCMIGGSDWGETLYGMFVAGWFMLATIPIGVVLIAAWVVAEIVAWIRRKRAAGNRDRQVN